MTSTPRITNAVLQERQVQQHTQVMLSLARVEDKLTTFCQRQQDAEVSSVEDRARITAVETQQETMKTDLAGVRARTLKLIVAVALLSGASSVAVDRFVGVLFP